MRRIGWVVDFTSAEQDAIADLVKHEQVAHGWREDLESTMAFLQRICAVLKSDSERVMPPWQ